MNKFTAVARLIRLPNLLIIAFVQIVARWCIEYALLRHPTFVIYSYNLKQYQLLTFDFEYQTSNFVFFMLVLATVLIAAGGYIINDYFDAETDAMNRPPEHVIVGTVFSKSFAFSLYAVCSIFGLAAGVYASVAVGLWQLTTIHVLVVGLLWYYSTTYKRQLIIGNVIVSLLAALVPFIVVIYDIPPMIRHYRPTMLNYDLSFSYIMHWFAGFAFFAFITTLIREIIKDMQDLEGDSAYGRNTLPVALGMQASKIITIVLIAATIGCLAWVNYGYFPKHLQFHAQQASDAYPTFLHPDNITFWYVLIFVVLPLLLIIVRLLTASEQKHYAQASAIGKLVMLTGISYGFVMLFMFQKFILALV